MAIIAAIVIGELISINWHSNPENIVKYETDNPHIVDSDLPLVSAHRSGGGIAPEETMMAFKNCAENPGFDVDIFEFDLHITKDDVLVLPHDDTLDRTSNSQEVFGRKDVRPEEFTYDELRSLNMGAKFEDEDGNMPYAELENDAVPDELRILRLEDVLDYLISTGEHKYIIEIKNSGDLGMKGVDILYNIIKERGILEDVIFGSFHEEVSHYVDDNYRISNAAQPLKRCSAFTMRQILTKRILKQNMLPFKFLTTCPSALQANLGTAKVINYAHEHGIAVQYWTVNNEKDLAYLSQMGADCIMTDYPDRLYKIVSEQNENAA